MSEHHLPEESKSNEKTESIDFIRQIIENDFKSNKHQGRVVTRFPPEPNGYLHIGHGKSICLNFGIALQYQGKCHLRFDDTNPSKESVEYVESIKEDVQWLGFDWNENEFFASDYYEQLYTFAVQLVKKGKAYVCHLNQEEIQEYRGTPTVPGKDSPYRNRTVEENLALLEQMRSGTLADGECVLRAKVDMSHPNLHMRDPAIYRIRHVPHHRTGDAWCMYPMYDFAHCLSDSIEGITHSLCTLEFEVHRPIYDWFLDQLEVPHHPQQIEFARLNLTHTLMSKRKLLELVEKNIVSGWDDPRMPTLSGLRRRGYTPKSIRTFSEKIGIAKRENIIDVALLEHCLREDLEETAPRVMAVLNPLKVVIENYPEHEVESFDFPYHPENPAMGSRKVPFSKIIYIEQDDFMENPPKKFYRLSPGCEVRLRYAYLITCTGVKKDPTTGAILEVHCTYDPATKGGSAPDGRKVKGTLHWVSVQHAVPTEVRIYEPLFTEEDPSNPADGSDPLDHVNPHSLQIQTGYMEPSLKDALPGTRFQFERLGYFCADANDHRPDRPVYNRTVPLKDSWSKIAAKTNK